MQKAELIFALRFLIKGSQKSAKSQVCWFKCIIHFDTEDMQKFIESADAMLAEMIAGEVSASENQQQFQQWKAKLTQRGSDAAFIGEQLHGQHRRHELPRMQARY